LRYFNNIIYVDLDGTLCSLVNDGDYSKATPLYNNINIINNLYINNHIVIYTARGSITKIDWYDITISQLKKWGIKYHELNIGNKPAWDLYIGDKCININNIEEHLNEVDNTRT
jgi:beta-glucanase (GH16 family)